MMLQEKTDLKTDISTQSSIDKLTAGLLDHRSSLINVAYRITNEKETAEDIVQDTFLQVMKSAEQYSESASPKTYLYRIVVNKSIDFVRRRKRTGTILESFFQNKNPVSIWCDKLETSDLIRQIFEPVPLMFRVPLILAESEGLTYEEIAIMLNISVNTVRTRIFRCRERLRKELKKMGLQ